VAAEGADEPSVDEALESEPEEDVGDEVAEVELAIAPSSVDEAMELEVEDAVELSVEDAVSEEPENVEDAVVVAAVLVAAEMVDEASVVELAF
jgi:hypothetical protein